MLDLLGEVVRVLGNRTRAVALFQEGLRYAHRVGRMQNVALGLVRLATVATTDRQYERAARLCGAAEALGEAVLAPLPRFERGAYDRTVAAIHSRLNDPAVAGAWAVGRALPLERAIGEALRPDDAPSSAVQHLGAPPAAPSIRPDGLSEREVEVLRLLAAGKSNKEIADALVISLNTVYRHVTHIFEKTGAVNRTEAAAYAIRHGLTG
jgi:non-specific serine/threonine protein kinase